MIICDEEDRLRVGWACEKPMAALLGKVEKELMGVAGCLREGRTGLRVLYLACGLLRAGTGCIMSFCLWNLGVCVLR